MRPALISSSSTRAAVLATVMGAVGMSIAWRKEASKIESAIWIISAGSSSDSTVKPRAFKAGTSEVRAVLVSGLRLSLISPLIPRFSTNGVISPIWLPLNCRRVNPVKLTRGPMSLSWLLLRSRAVSPVRLATALISVSRLWPSSSRVRLVLGSKPVRSVRPPSGTLSCLNWARSALCSSSVGISNLWRIALSKLASLKVTISAAGSSYSTFNPRAIKAGR